MTKIKTQIFPFLPTLLFSVLYLPHITLPLRLDTTSAKIRHEPSTMLRIAAGPPRHAWTQPLTLFVGSAPLHDQRLARGGSSACTQIRVSGLWARGSSSPECLCAKKGIGFARRCRSLFPSAPASPCPVLTQRIALPGSHNLGPCEMRRVFLRRKKTTKYALLSACGRVLCGPPC